MNTRDYDYIEHRLLDVGPAMEAAGRLAQVGQQELANRVLAAAAVFGDALRDVRRELPAHLYRGI